MAHHDADSWQRFVLLETLDLAVPMHMVELQRCSPEALCGIASEAATFVGSHGDALQFGGKKCAPAFNQLARGLAAAALIAWGGVTFQGLHWCTVPGCTGPDTDHPQPVNPQPVPADIARALNARPITDLHLPDPDSSSTEAA
ncbi:hypothetical protein ABZX39_33140 [Streptomyces collinus]|uniref:hypothetical protein n=1 Tax=Streptomyces collinus TaxID=42684 RepID=UPI0033BEC39F